MAARSPRRLPPSARVYAPAAGTVAGTGLALVVFIGMRGGIVNDSGAGEATGRRTPPPQVSVSLRSAEPDAAGDAGTRPFDPVLGAANRPQAGETLPLHPLFVARGVVDDVVAQVWTAAAPAVPVPAALPPSAGGTTVTPGGGVGSPPGGVPATDPPTTPPPITDPPTDPPPDPGLPGPGGGDPSGGDPGVPDPGTVDPGATDPGTVDPGPVDPGTVDPGTTDPGTTDPGSGDPGTAGTGGSDAGTVDPTTVTDPTTASGLGTDPTPQDVPAA